MKPQLCFVAAALGMYFFAVNTTAHAQQVKAETGGVAIGRDVIQSTVVIGARLRYSEAAKHFAKAAGVFAPNGAYEDKRISYLLIRCRVLAVKIANELRNKRPV